MKQYHVQIDKLPIQCSLNFIEMNKNQLQPARFKFNLNSCFCSKNVSKAMYSDFVVMTSNMQQCNCKVIKKTTHKHIGFVSISSSYDLS